MHRTTLMERETISYSWSQIQSILNDLHNSVHFHLHVFIRKNVILHISSYFLAHAITLKIFHSNKTLIITLAFQETNTLNISES